MVRDSKVILLVILVPVFLIMASSDGLPLPQEQLEEARLLLEKAKEEQAEILSPDTYRRAEKEYNEAVEKTKNNESLDKIRKLLNEAIQLTNTALRNSDLARVTFVDVLPARQKAIHERAPELVKDAWDEADKVFYEAASSLEDGDANNAKKKAVRAQDLFSDAELLAIKEDIINETGRLISSLEQEGVGDIASVTLEKARKHLAEAENVLNRDRYRKEDAEAINKVARYEAEHARNLSERIRGHKKDKISGEVILLEFEEHLMKIAKEIRLSLRFDKGMDPQVEALRGAVGGLKSERDNFSTELDELQKKYAGTQEDRRTINEQLRQERIKRERVERVSALFKSDEAKVLQEGDNVIIRLTGFTFPSGTAVIEPAFFPLLTKVQKSIEEFPSSHIAIEGHTDSKGEDSFNLKLSQKRADAIRTYLVANLGINPERIVAVGYGESRPIANNDTGQGRAMNRRVDVVIEPRD